METTFFLVSGAAIAALGIYVYSKRNSAYQNKAAFLANKSKFTPLINKIAKGEFSVDEWSDMIIEIKDPNLYKWWRTLISRNKGNVELIHFHLFTQLQKWGVTIPNDGQSIPPKDTHGPQDSQVPPPLTPPKSCVPASKAFIENIERFKPLLNGLEKCQIDKKQWSDLIVDIHNQELVEIWKKVVNNPQAFLRILASWGLTYDNCIEFKYLKGREEMYDNLEGTGMLEGKTYAVISPCWIFTNPDGNKVVILKGSVKLKD